MLLEAATGKLRGEWRCWGPQSGPGPGAPPPLGGVPYGVRVLSGSAGGGAGGGGNLDGDLLGDLDLIFVAAADFPSDARHQYVHVLSGAALGTRGGGAHHARVSGGGDGGARGGGGGGDGDGGGGSGGGGSGGGVDPCMPLETLRVDASSCVTPHELGVDRRNGDVYLACVTANASLGATRGLLRYRLVARDRRAAGSSAAGSAAGAGAAVLVEAPQPGRPVTLKGHLKKVVRSYK